MSKYQIRDDVRGLALYDAKSPREALLSFLADRAKGEMRPLVKVGDDGTASITVDGKTYRTAVV